MVVLFLLEMLLFEDVLVSVPVLPAGDYNVTVTYNGDANYTEAIGKANFTVSAIDSSVTVNLTNITYGDNETIKFNVTDGATGTVNITVTGVDGVVATLQHSMMFLLQMVLLVLMLLI